MIKIKTKEKDYFSFIDIKHTVNILNKNVEWNDYLLSVKQIPHDDELSKEIKEELSSNIEIDSNKSILPLEKLKTIIEEKEDIVSQQPLFKLKTKSSIFTKPRKEIKPIKKEKKVKTEDLEEVEIL